jgi:hypothetical protein
MCLVRDIRWDDVDWVDVAQDRDQWRASVNTFGFHKMLGSSCVAAQLTASQEGLSSVSELYSDLLKGPVNILASIKSCYPLSLRGSAGTYEG